MKYPFLICLWVFSQAMQAQRTKVEFPVMYTKPYCGGARPGEEIQNQSEKPLPYANSTLVIVKDNKKIDSLKTDNKGYFRKKMKKGNYKVYEAWRYNLFTPNNLPIESFDKNCLIPEWEKPCMTITVQKKEFRQVIINPIIQFCDWNAPCLNASEIPPGRQ